MALLDPSKVKQPMSFNDALTLVQQEDERLIAKGYDLLLKNKVIPIVTVDKDGKSRKLAPNKTPILTSLDETNQMTSVPLEVATKDVWVLATYSASTGLAMEAK